MENTAKAYGIIPARYGSSRFPGKPLANILGKPMFWHVFHRASMCDDLKEVILATDDKRIFSKAQELNVPVVMTKGDHRSGTDRVVEAAEKIGIPSDAVVVNIQGDEPVIEPAMLTQLLAPFKRPDVFVTTLARQIDSDEAKNPDLVKVVLTHDNKALYFSRSVIPYQRSWQNTGYLGHLGLYGFCMKTLKEFVSLPQGDLERTEKLEQLRLLENNISIHVVITGYKTIGVDRPEDIKKVVEILQNNSNFSRTSGN